MKAVIQTQFLENYGAHDWDGKGECPQYWKPKGGSTYIIDITIEQNMDPEFWSHLMSCIEYSSDYAREYSIGETVVDDIDFEQSDHCADWDAPKYLEILEDGRIFSTETRTWDDWRHEELLGERWTRFMLQGGETENDLLEYILKDGTTMTYQQWTNRAKDTRSVA